MRNWTLLLTMGDGIDLKGIKTGLFWGWYCSSGRFSHPGDSQGRFTAMCLRHNQWRPNTRSLIESLRRSQTWIPAAESVGIYKGSSLPIGWRLRCDLTAGSTDGRRAGCVLYGTGSMNPGNLRPRRFRRVRGRGGQLWLQRRGAEGFMKSRYSAGGFPFSTCAEPPECKEEDTVV